MAWEFRYDFDAVQSIYALPRGAAGEVTAAIQSLASDPRPENAKPIPGRANTFRLGVERYTIDYELVEPDQIVKILFIG